MSMPRLDIGGDEDPESLVFECLEGRRACALGEITMGTVQRRSWLAGASRRRGSPSSATLDEDEDT